MKLQWFKCGLLLCIITIFGIQDIKAQLVVTYRSTESESDRRYDYEQDLIKLALEKTKGVYGDYEMRPSPEMNQAKAYQALKEKSYENLIINMSVNDRYLRELGYIPFPLAKGVYGYRVFFTSNEIAKELKQVESLKELKEFTVGQGEGWIDVEILRNSGFEVTETSSFEDLFDMVANNEVDLFARGTNEVLSEYNNYNTEVDNLELDRSVVLYYPLPRFLFTSKGNDVVIERLQVGIRMAMQDGSFNRLWEDHYMESIEFVNLTARTLFTIKNPLLQNFNMGMIRHYIYNPFRKSSK